ncbi:hypothetical protein E2C01_093470 [Portunus trituberculatus]|uniref:Uncharacterized protein n=1 Tax=Portunus trituberculatus TaxID=210409 RepID=A0A5B7JYU3_PORTR|nr:hypothetical protein [Portunus trituberculatus]
MQKGIRNVVWTRRRVMTVRQSSPQLGSRERDIIRLPSSRRKVYAERLYSLAVTCARGYRSGDSPRVCHRSPRRQQNWWGRSRLLPSNSAEFVKDIRKRSAGVNERDISFPRGSLCLFQDAAGSSSAAPKSVQTLRVSTMSPETEKAARFCFTAFVYAAFHQGTGRLVKRSDVLGIV